jgi:hypothetical protein
MTPPDADDVMVDGDIGMLVWSGRFRTGFVSDGTTASWSELA